MPVNTIATSIIIIIITVIITITVIKASPSCEAALLTTIQSSFEGLCRQ
jgi:hypothetical protein